MIKVKTIPEENSVELAMRGELEDLVYDVCIINETILKNIQESDVMASKLMAKALVIYLNKFLEEDVVDLDHTADDELIQCDTNALAFLQKLANNQNNNDMT